MRSRIPVAAKLVVGVSRVSLLPNCLYCVSRVTIGCKLFVLIPSCWWWHGSILASVFHTLCMALLASLCSWSPLVVHFCCFSTFIWFCFCVNFVSFSFFLCSLSLLLLLTLPLALRKTFRAVPVSLLLVASSATVLPASFASFVVSPILLQCSVFLLLPLFSRVAAVFVYIIISFAFAVPLFAVSFSDLSQRSSSLGS